MRTGKGVIDPLLLLRKCILVQLTVFQPDTVQNVIKRIPCLNLLELVSEVEQALEDGVVLVFNVQSLFLHQLVVLTGKGLVAVLQARLLRQNPLHKLLVQLRILLEILQGDSRFIQRRLTVQKGGEARAKRTDKGKVLLKSSLIAGSFVELIIGHHQCGFIVACTAVLLKQIGHIEHPFL